MDKLLEFYLKIEAWTKKYPLITALISMFLAGLIVGGILF